MARKHSDPEAKPKIFKKYRGGISLTKEEIATIKRERKKLRKDMKKRGIKYKHECFVMDNSGEVIFRFFTFSNDKSGFNEFYSKIQKLDLTHEKKDKVTFVTITFSKRVIHLTLFFVDF